MTVSAQVDRTRYESDVDLFSKDSLIDPYADYKSLRDVGRIAYMTRYHMWTVTRYDEVKRVLADPETFASGQGIGMNDTLNAAWKGVPPTLDGDAHVPMHRVMMQTIGPKAALQYQQQIETAATRIVDDVIERGEFDAVVDLAQVVPCTIILDLIGVPSDTDTQTRRDLLHWATDTYNNCGPDGTFDDTLPSMQKLYEYSINNYSRDKLRPGSIGQLAFEAADRGAITEVEALGILMGYATAGLDTTGSALGSLMMLLAYNPDQWRILRDDPSLIPSAALEGLRIESPAQWFTRVTTKDVAFDDVVITKGTRMLHSYGAANRDERHFPDPDRFDVRRNPTDHLAFGFGVHACMGKSLSNLEVHAVLKELTRRVDRIEPAGEPQRHVNNLIRGLESVPVRVYLR